LQITAGQAFSLPGPFSAASWHVVFRSSHAYARARTGALTATPKSAHFRHRPMGHDDREQKNEERISAFRDEDTIRALKAR